MTQTGSKRSQFVWDETKLKAAEAVAKGDCTQNQIVTELGVSRRTLIRWAEHPEFQTKVNEIIADIDIAQKAERIKIAKKEIKRVIMRLDLNEDKPTSRDLVALLKFVAEEVGDYSEHKTIKFIWDDTDEGTNNKDTI